MRRGLGRGISALIPAPDEDRLLEIPPEAIAPNPRQPRGRYDPESLEALARSIREVGILQPLVVRRNAGGYELIAGERRLRAAKLAGLPTVPALLRESDDTQSLREALIENLHREDLGPLELAAAFEELLRELNASQEELARRLGVSRPHVANTVRLLQLPPEVQRLLAEGSIQAGHARALLALPYREPQVALALRAAAEELSVRQVEQLVRRYGVLRTGVVRGNARPRSGDPSLAEAEEVLSRRLATRVQIRTGRSRGRIVVEFGSLEDLHRLVAEIAGQPEDPEGNARSDPGRQG